MSLAHREAEALLPAYRKGTLERAQVKALHEHFKDCEACRARIRLEGAARRRDLEEADPSPASPLVQAQMARNRDLLVKFLLLLALAWFVYRMKR